MKAVYLLLIVIGLNTQLLAQDVNIQWLDVDELEDKYRTNPKPILFFLYTDWCKYCKIQENTTFSEEDIVEIINKEVYPLKLNAESKETFVFFGREYGFIEEEGFHALAIYLAGEDQLEFPTTVILDKMMEPVYRKSAVIDKREMKMILP